MLNCSIGKYGETLALNFLKNSNYLILTKNFRCKKGEIDIICKYNDIIVFIEVKTRYSNTFGTASSSVNFIKQNKIINVSKYYLQKNNLFNYFIRFDVIEVFLNTKKDTYDINHIPDAFRLS